MMWLFGFALLGLIGVATYFILEQNNNKAKRDRALALIGTGIAPQAISKQKDATARHARDAITKKLKLASSNEKSGDNTKSVAALLTQAGSSMTITQFWAMSVFSAVLCCGLLLVMTHKPVLAVLGGVIGLFGLPRMILKMAIKKRQKAFLDDFSDALEAMARLLKAGMPIGEAIAMCAREYTGPVGEEMRRLYDAQKIGVPLSTAAMEAAARMPIPEMRMLAIGLVIQQQTGSSLSEVLENLAGMIRARYRLKRKIVALSSEATASAAIIGALPILVCLALKLVRPDYIALLFTQGLGQTLLYGALIWMSMGILVMRQMINFKI